MTTIELDRLALQILHDLRRAGAKGPITLDGLKRGELLRVANRLLEFGVWMNKSDDVGFLKSTPPRPLLIAIHARQ